MRERWIAYRAALLPLAAAGWLYAEQLLLRAQRPTSTAIIILLLLLSAFLAGRGSERLRSRRTLALLKGRLRAVPDAARAWIADADRRSQQ